MPCAIGQNPCHGALHNLHQSTPSCGPLAGCIITLRTVHTQWTESAPYHTADHYDQTAVNQQGSYGFFVLFYLNIMVVAVHMLLLFALRCVLTLVLLPACAHQSFYLGQASSFDGGGL